MQRLRNYAEPLANRSKAELWDNVLNASIDGNILPPGELKELAEDGMISPEQRAQYLSTYHGPGKPEFDATIYEDAFSVISRYSPDQDPTGATLAQLRGQLATLPLPAESSRNYPSASPIAPHHRSRRLRSGTGWKGISKREQTSISRRGSSETGSSMISRGTPREIRSPARNRRRSSKATDWSKALTTKRRFLDQWGALP